MRHNALRDTEKKIMEEVCKDVQIEPHLIPTTAEMSSGNITDKARLDISAIGVWGQYEKSYFDVRVTHPNAASYLDKTMNSIYHIHEVQKKTEYNDRILNNEHASFTPLVFTTTGGMGPECERLNKRLAELLSRKRKEPYSKIMAYIRNRLRFSLLRTILHAVRGVRGRSRTDAELEIEDISFNLIPTEAY